MVMSLKKSLLAARALSAPPVFEMGSPAANVAAAHRRLAHLGQSGSAEVPQGKDSTAPAAAGSRPQDDAPAQAKSKRHERVMTYAEVADALNVATGSDALNAAADLIRHVKDDAQRTELTQLYSTRAAEFDERGV